eukprot:56833-Rhodomonas_salina.6
MLLRFACSKVSPLRRTVPIRPAHLQRETGTDVDCATLSGSLQWRPPLFLESKFAKLGNVAYPDEVAAILDIMRDPKMIFDMGPDTVDQVTSTEMCSVPTRLL